MCGWLVHVVNLCHNYTVRGAPVYSDDLCLNLCPLPSLEAGHRDNRLQQVIQFVHHLNLITRLLDRMVQIITKVRQQALNPSHRFENQRCITENCFWSISAIRILIGTVYLIGLTYKVYVLPYFSRNDDLVDFS